MEGVKLLIILIFLSFNGLSNDCSQALGGKPAYVNGEVFSKERKLLEDMANIDQGTLGFATHTPPLFFTTTTASLFKDKN